MRVVAWVLIGLTVCAGVLIVFSLYAAELRITVGEVRVVPAAEMQDQFLALKQAVEERALLGRQFLAEPIGEPSAYEFHIYNVHLRNNGLIPADWVRLEVRPDTGDVLQTENENANILPAMSDGELQAVVLAQQGAGTARKLSLTYFIWSRFYNILIEGR